MVAMRYTEVAVALLVVSLGTPLIYAAHILLFKWHSSWRTRRRFEAQGVSCLPRHFFFGNMLDIGAITAKVRSEPMSSMSHGVANRLQPHLHLWSKIYGDHFVFWFGFQARYVLKDPEQAKELLTTKTENFGKTTRRPDANDLLGKGLLVLNGEEWAQHRHIVNSAFFVEKLKAMAPVMVDLTNVMMKNWESRIQRKESINVAREFKVLTADIIAHTAFGSSFAEGKLVFEMQDKQQELFSKLLAAPYIPGYRFLPTPQNRYRNSLKTRIHQELGQIIQKREALADAARGDLYGNNVPGSMYGNDLLGLMLAANKGELQGNQKSFTMGLDELIDECKTFFFAGHETTATLLTFMFLLLATHPDWQERLRDEVFEACGKTQLPTAESLNLLKLVGMVINETLRLYPPATALYREAGTDMSLGEILVPAGTVIVIPIIAWQQDERYWGPDAKEFNPERFREGIARACKLPGAYLPFAMGPRNCVGQVFAIMEAKMVVATILQRYRFRLSPQYVHAPTVVLTTRPQFGMPIIFESLF